MYRVVRASALYYENHMRGCKGRYDLVKPILLLVDKQKFSEAKRMMSSDYINLCQLFLKMRELNCTGEDKYHHFDMLLKELEVLGFNPKPDNYIPLNAIDENTIKDQIDLLLQFLSFRYPFDEYDNKTGVHDIKTNEFIFIQP